jgi:hypothetical protein
VKKKLESKQDLGLALICHLRLDSGMAAWIWPKAEEKMPLIEF